MRVLISGGGTGGHIMPGLAVAAKLRELCPGVELLWVGVKGRKEAELAPRHGLPFAAIAGRGFKRSLTPAALSWNVGALGAVVLGLFQAWMVLRRFKPHVVLGTGGYVCFPVIVCAWLQRIPRIICEQNSVPGLTVKLLARIADRIAVTYEATRTYLPARAKCVVTGNPVDAERLRADPVSARRELDLPQEKLILLVMGGSLGAGAINAVIIAALKAERWRATLSHDWFILHAAGSDKFEAVKQETAAAPSYRVVAYIYENYKALAAADAMIARAGATTLAEITARGLPSLLAPWRGAAHDHQTSNAKLIAERGAAEVVDERELTAARVLDFLERLARQPELRQQMGAKASSLAVRDAAARIAGLAIELAVPGKRS